MVSRSESACSGVSSKRSPLSEPVEEVVSRESLLPQVGLRGALERVAELLVEHVERCADPTRQADAHRREGDRRHQASADDDRSGHTCGQHSGAERRGGAAQPVLFDLRVRQRSQLRPQLRGLRLRQLVGGGDSVSDRIRLLLRSSREAPSDEPAPLRLGWRTLGRSSLEDIRRRRHRRRRRSRSGSGRRRHFEATRTQAGETETHRPPLSAHMLRGCLHAITLRLARSHDDTAGHVRVLNCVLAAT